jgi:hypothetical protein
LRHDAAGEFRRLSPLDLHLDDRRRLCGSGTIPGDRGRTDRLKKSAAAALSVALGIATLWPGH